MYQRKNTPTISTLQYCQHTREYLKEARTGKGTTGSVLGTSPFLTKASPGAGTRKTGAAAHHGGKGQGTRDRHPASSTGKDQTITRPGPRHTDGRPSRKTTTRATRKVSLAVLPLFSVVARDTPPHLAPSLACVLRVKNRWDDHAEYCSVHGSSQTN